MHFRTGDLIIKFKQKPHKVFERKGDDLYTNVTISLTDALTGFDMNIKHLDGHLVNIKREKITWPGSKLRKPNEGMVNFENNKKIGTLFITFDVDFPKGELSAEDKEQIKAILKETESKTRTYNGLRGY